MSVCGLCSPCSPSTARAPGQRGASASQPSGPRCSRAFVGGSRRRKIGYERTKLFSESGFFHEIGSPSPCTFFTPQSTMASLSPSPSPSPPRSSPSPSRSVPPPHPVACGLPSCSMYGTNTCSGCGAMWYCSREHQTSHWKAHKVVCRLSRKRSPAAAGGGAGAVPAAQPPLPHVVLMSALMKVGCGKELDITRTCKLTSTCTAGARGGGSGLDDDKPPADALLRYPSGRRDRYVRIETDLLRHVLRVWSWCLSDLSGLSYKWRCAEGKNQRCVHLPVKSLDPTLFLTDL